MGRKRRGRRLLFIDQKVPQKTRDNGDNEQDRNKGEKYFRILFCGILSGARRLFCRLISLVRHKLLLKRV